MPGWTTILLAVGLVASAAPAADPPSPTWQGVWSGTVGSAPVRLCLDGNPYWSHGSYYYLSRLTPIPLNRDKDRWLEGHNNGKARASLQFDKIAPLRIEGRWVGGAKSLPVTLDRVAIRAGEEDMGPCGSTEYIQPRLGPTRVVATPGKLGATAYRKLALVVPASFTDVSIESFALPGSSPAIARINRSLAAPLSAKSASEGWQWCMQNELSSLGDDGYYSESLSPTMIGRRYLSVTHHNDGSCGGAHPYSDNVSQTYALASGVEIDLFAWLTARAIKRERYDGTSGEAKTVTPAFRKFILAGWKAEQAECREGIERADFWDIALTRTGFGFTPSLAHVEQACTETIAVPFSRLQPWLTAAGKAGILGR